MSFSLHALAKSERLANELQDVRLVRQPIEQGSRQALVAEDLRPIAKRKLVVTITDTRSYSAEQNWKINWRR